MDIQTINNATMRVLNNECYDMQENYSNEDIVNTVGLLVNQLNRSSIAIAELGECSVKVRNDTNGSFVSVSSSEFGTGVSRSLYLAYNASYPVEEAVKELIDMINEAWYTMIDL